ncbi:hypothetical protein Vadar_033647 [Vaccinium darrowii]|uniref:Uncharacterized protein n=1 Tax=Vaccinium darrowii TaxID=229202 RepID=A0ACB7YSH5_9ERIC|nr:hypothetical protein Vadar_033647 [Vaccinium darrowii]
MIVATPFDQPMHQIQHNRRIRPVFQGAVGALDGTLISAVVPPDQQVPYRGRGKGECYQNVLAICDFDMLFTFVWAGWEGVAHDSRVALASSAGPFLEEVREAQLGLDLENVKSIDAKGLELEPDNLHLTTPAQVQLGEMLASSFLQTPS